MAGGENKADSGELFLYSPLKVVFFVALMCVMLVLMYYFYNYLGEWDKKTALVYSKGEIISVDLCCLFVCFSHSLRHYCYILPGICLCTLQLFRCSDGTNWLRHCEVLAHSLFKKKKKRLYSHTYSTVFWQNV